LVLPGSRCGAQPEQDPNAHAGTISTVLRYRLRGARKLFSNRGVTVGALPWAPSHHWWVPGLPALPILRTIYGKCSRKIRLLGLPMRSPIRDLDGRLPLRERGFRNPARARRCAVCGLIPSTLTSRSCRAPERDGCGRLAGVESDDGPAPTSFAPPSSLCAKLKCPGTISPPSSRLMVPALKNPAQCGHRGR